MAIKNSLRESARLAREKQEIGSKMDEIRGEVTSVTKELANIAEKIAKELDVMKIIKLKLAEEELYNEMYKVDQRFIAEQIRLADSYPI